MMRGLAETKPPAMVLMDLIVGPWLFQALHVAAKIGAADLLADGPKTADEIARPNQVDAKALRRVLRALAGGGVFKETADGRFELTPAAELLRSGVPGSLRGMAIAFGEPWSWSAWGDLRSSIKTGEPAFDLTFGQPLFDYFDDHPGVDAAYGEALTGWAEQTLPAIPRAYDFTRFRRVIDIVGNVFDWNPPPGDLYVLRQALHDWDDEPAALILTHCRRTIDPGGRILLAEIVVPPGNEPSIAKALDLERLAISGGRERTEAEYRDLLATAGFRWLRTLPTDSFLTLIEAEPA